MQRFILSTILTLTVLAKSLSAEQANEEISKLSLSSQATVRLPPDELQLKIGVVTLSDSAETALQDNATRMQAVVKAIIDIGLARSDFETGHFAIHPTYTPYPKNAPPDWKPSISGYEVNNSILVHTDQIDLAGKLIDAANRAGANSINDIQFGLHDPHSDRDQAIAAATANALRDAKVIAKSAGVKLVRIISITLDNAHAIAPRIYAAKAMAAESSTPIEPGDVSLTASVSVVYEIAPEDGNQ
jgi:uncharacterized protein